MDEVRPDYGINEDDAMTIPNFFLMERFLVIGGKHPNLFYKNIMKVIYPANRKKSSEVIYNHTLKGNGIPKTNQ